MAPQLPHAPADKMTSLFAFTLYVRPPDTNSTASATRGVFLSFWAPALNSTLVASAPVSTTRFFLCAFGSKYPVSAEDRVPDRGSTARAGVKKPVASPVSCKSERRGDVSSKTPTGSVIIRKSADVPGLSSFWLRGCSRPRRTLRSGQDKSCCS